MSSSNIEESDFFKIKLQDIKLLPERTNSFVSYGFRRVDLQKNANQFSTVVGLNDFAITPQRKELYLANFIVYCTGSKLVFDYVKIFWADKSQKSEYVVNIQTCNALKAPNALNYCHLPIPALLGNIMGIPCKYVPATTFELIFNVSSPKDGEDPLYLEFEIALPHYDPEDVVLSTEEIKIPAILSSKNLVKASYFVISHSYPYNDKENASFVVDLGQIEHAALLGLIYILPSSSVDGQILMHIKGNVIINKQIKASTTCKRFIFSPMLFSRGKSVVGIDTKQLTNLSFKFLKVKPLKISETFQLVMLFLKE